MILVDVQKMYNILEFRVTIVVSHMEKNEN